MRYFSYIVRHFIYAKSERYIIDSKLTMFI